MTARANSLTQRVNRSAGHSGSPLTVRANDLSAMTNALGAWAMRSRDRRPLLRCGDSLSAPAAEGVSYQDLLDEARKEVAGRHISESRLSVGEVAYQVGYSEPAPFHRAFKRWYGMTPEGFRQKQREGR